MLSSAAVRIADLFAGGGGVTEGARRAGMNVVFAANHWAEAVEHHARKHPKTMHVCQDLHQYDFRQMPDHDIMWASPACQGHSEASQPARSKDESVAVAHDHLRTTAWAVTTAVLAKQPRAFVVENVPEFREWRPPGIVVSTHRTKNAAQRKAQELSLRAIENLEASTDDFVVWRQRKGGGWAVLRFREKGVLYRHWMETFRLAGYQLTEQVLTASRWGVPQRRRRLIVVGTLNRALPIQERPGEEPTLEGVLDPTIGPWIRIKDITRAGARKRAEYAHEKYKGDPCWGYHVSHRGGWARGLDEPSTTVTTQNHHYMVADGGYRLWTVPETSRVMGFEADYFHGVGRTTALKMAGNAVPPPMAGGILQQVAAVL